MLPLLEHADIVAPYLVRRSLPFDGLLYQWASETEVRTPNPDPGGPVIDVDQCSTGGMLCHRRVFEGMKYPWFRTGEFDGEHQQDDTGFCRRARLDGYKIVCDPSIVFGHLVRVFVWPGKADHVVLGMADGVGLPVPRSLFREAPRAAALVGLTPNGTAGPTGVSAR